MLNPQEEILRKQLSEMVTINPKRSISHHTCDFVGENFMDRIQEAGYKGSIDKAISYFEQNKRP